MILESNKVLSRKAFLQRIILAGAVNSFGKIYAKYNSKYPIKKHTKEVHCDIYRSVNGSPAKNIIKVIGMMGGIKKLIGLNDVIVIKPNLQWWNQGAPNPGRQTRTSFLP